MLSASFNRLVEAAIVPFAEVLTLAAFGYLLALPGVNVLTDKARRLLGKLVFALFLPCLIFAYLGDTLTLERMRLWWFIPVNVIIAAVSGCFMGLLVVAFARPPPRFYRLTIVMTGIGNIGNIPLAIVNSICRRKVDNPFGSPAECHHHGVAYIAFAQWVGAFIIYTFVYHMLEPPEEFYEIVAPDTAPGAVAALPDGSLSPTPLSPSASLPILANALSAAASPEPQSRGVWPSVQKLLPGSWFQSRHRSSFLRQQEHEHYQRLIASPNQASRQLLETEFPSLLEVTARAPQMKEPLLARLFRSLSITNFEGVAGSAVKDQAAANGTVARAGVEAHAAAAAAATNGCMNGFEAQEGGANGHRSDGQQRGRESAVLDAMERNAVGEEEGMGDVRARVSWDKLSSPDAAGCSCVCVDCKEKSCVGDAVGRSARRSSRDADAAGAITDANGCTCSINVEPCTDSGRATGSGRVRVSSRSSVTQSSCGDVDSDCSDEDDSTEEHKETRGAAAENTPAVAAAAENTPAVAAAAENTPAVAAAAAAEHGYDHAAEEEEESDKEGDDDRDLECVPCLQEPQVMRKMRVVAERTPIRHLMQPPVIASLLAILVGATPHLKALLFGPSAPFLFVVDSLTILSGGMIPCIMLVLGGNMISGPGGGSGLGVRTTAAISGVRLLVSPLVGMAVVLLADWLKFLPPGDKMFRLVLLLQHSMPSSILAGAMASLRGYGEKEVSSLLFWQHILSAFSLTLFLALYLHWLI
ncbi:hypothetical protein CLOM_g20102 [Closterium sp. NIES-68]|nr:hypothetical protein CLOM_g20102 [Closterium sp. NIES-68]GJP85049.1 hypothetical protein CLOP_g15154 [Closterium sp. NIES-67]